MIDSNNKLKSLSKSLIESARKIMSEKKTDKGLAKLAPPYDKVTHGDVLVGRKVYTHDQVKAHKAKKGIKEDADMVVVNAPVLADIDGELAEVLKRDPRDKTVHIQLEGMKYILKKDQYEELPEAVKNPYAVGMAAAMKSTGDKPPLKKSTITKAHEIAKKVDEEVEELEEVSKKTLASYIKKAVPSKRGLEDSSDRLHQKGHAAYTAGATKTSDKMLSLSQKQYDKAIRRGEGINKAADKLAKEEFEQIDELSRKTLGSYVSKAAKSATQNIAGAVAAGVSGTPSQHGREMGRKSVQRLKGIDTAAKKLAKEEVEEIDELSKDAVTAYANRAFDQSNNILKMRHKDLPKSAMKAAEVAKERRRKGILSAGKRLGQDAMMDIASKAATRVREDVELTQEEIDRLDAIMADLEEARGRPPKEGSAAWKAKQQQDLSDMPALGVQIRKAASINKPVTFMNGESKQISNGHINKFHDHLDARKTSQDKAAFQKRAHKSHDEFVKAVSEPVPGHSKDTGEIVKYR